MKMQALKQEVFSLTDTQDTKQLRKERPELAQGRDLRYKKHWEEILAQVNALREAGLDLSLEDLEASEAMLKQSLVKVGRMSGLSDEQIETDWQRIQLESQFSDIHIEAL
ncbi:MAG: hypothetical protein HC771_15910 [Synechococcales cyanobacterium CRU_2_2]|nr:hypothetical protein [Synechococcales cyanobacterium CRU_2_2]